MGVRGEGAGWGFWRVFSSFLLKRGSHRSRAQKPGAGKCWRAAVTLLPRAQAGACWVGCRRDRRAQPERPLVELLVLDGPSLAPFSKALQLRGSSLDGPTIRFSWGKNIPESDRGPPFWGSEILLQPITQGSLSPQSSR